MTDVEEGFIKNDTFNEFKKYSVEIRHLLSIHAKIYIVDDWCLVTSANLTGTAFMCRYEMGFASDNVTDVENTFVKWWNMAKSVSALPKKSKKALIDYQDGTFFSRKFKAPAYRTGAHDKYFVRCQKYQQFANLYESVTGRNPKMVKDGFTLLQEIDYMFNYLYHDHPNTPTNKCKQVRSLNQSAQRNEIIKYYKDTCIGYNSDPQGWRLERTNTIKQLLSPQHIDKLTWNDVNEVVKCFHCLASYPINRTKFVNPSNNNLKTIIDCWKNLLHTGDITYDKIKNTTDKLRFFGSSSAYELIGWYYPNEYPLMNGNSDCGMRYFGFDV